MLLIRFVSIFRGVGFVEGGRLIASLDPHTVKWNQWNNHQQFFPEFDWGQQRGYYHCFHYWEA